MALIRLTIWNSGDAVGSPAVRRVPVLGPALIASLSRVEEVRCHACRCSIRRCSWASTSSSARSTRSARRPSDGYPPYNVERVGDNELRIILAVAGFTMDDLSVEIEGSQLVVRGKQTDDKDRVYLHRGIAARQFQRSFMLAEGIEAAGAWLEHGLLNIDLVRRAPDGRVRKIAIRGADGAALSNGGGAT